MLGRTSPMDQDFFRWTAEYVRVCHAPNEWFARARTSSKENTEALAGVHADEGVGIVIDEASGVPNQVFNTVEGALTSGNVFLVMISNGTEITGYFYDSHHSNKDLFQIFKFDGEESPMVDREYIKRKSRHGLHSDEYRIRVKGEFPREGGMSDGGFMQLIPIDRINVSVENEVRIPLVGRKILALDPAGEGKDKAVWVCRNKFRAKQVSEFLSSNDASMAEETIRLAVLLGIWPEDIVCGAFGVGADVGKKIALATALGINAGDISEIVGYQINPDTDNSLHRRYMTKRPWEIYTVMEGNTPETEEKYNGQFFRRTMDEVTDPNGGEPGQSYSTYRAVEYTDIYTNIRALMYFRARSWIYQGGLIVDNDQAENSQFAYELSQIMYKRALHGNKIQLEPKKDMKKRGVKSPNIGDAFALSMLRDLTEAKKYTAEEVEELTARDRVVGDDRFNAL
jgi:phage terminase large subunit